MWILDVYDFKQYKRDNRSLIVTNNKRIVMQGYGIKVIREFTYGFLISIHSESYLNGYDVIVRGRQVDVINGLGIFTSSLASYPR